MVKNAITAGGLLLLIATSARAGLIFDVHEFTGKKLTFELSGTLDGPLPAVNRDFLYIVSTTPNDTDWVLGTFSTSNFDLPTFSPGGGFPTLVTGGDSSPANHAKMDFISDLSVGSAVTTTGPYFFETNLTFFVPANVDGLALYWGKSSSGASDESGTFLASDSNLSGPNAVVPEPSSLVLLTTVALGMCGYGWRRRRKKTQQVA